MTPEEWREAKDLLAETLELPATERQAFLDLRCGGNPALRHELDALLAASEGDGFLDRELQPAPAGPAIAEGEILGPYKIQKKLAEGGMGAVYQAFDSRLDVARSPAARQAAGRNRGRSRCAGGPGPGGGARGGDRPPGSEA